MNEKENAKFSVGLLCAILFIFILTDVFTSDRFFSETEIRLLATKPEVTWEGIVSGAFQDQYGKAVKDQFPGRDKLVGIRDAIDRAIGIDEENGIYFGDNGYLFEVHLPEAYPEELQEEKAAMLERFVDDWEADVMLIPSSDNVLTDKLPFGAPVFDETAFLTLVREKIGEERYINVYETLIQHKDEALYYKTDSHWTSLGAYYGFEAWANHRGRYVYSFDLDNMTTVSLDFKGNLHKKVPVTDRKDEIKIFTETLDAKVLVSYDDQRTSASFYSDSYLTGNDQYGYFLDSGSGFTTIHTDSNGRNRILLITDSDGYAFVPLLFRSFTDICVVDLKNFEGDIMDLMSRFSRNRQTDVLLLFDCIDFLDNFSY